MLRQLIIGIILFPATVLILIPAAILYLATNTRWAAQPVRPCQCHFWPALLFAGIGIVLCVWTVTLFLRTGRGTPVPWAPPQKLVIAGPYRHLRNPMIAGVLLILVAEALYFQSWPLAIWPVVLFTAKQFYLPLVEEKGLEKRFGDEYRAYRKNVPRWLPRLTPWSPPGISP